MKNIFTLLSALVFFVNVNAQNQTITELRFPYKPGYTLLLTGNSTTYAQDGSKFNDSSITHYFINKDLDIKGQRWVNFHCKTDPKDTSKSFDSPLIVDEAGMRWSSDEKKISKKYVTEAIKLPLTQGATWTTYSNGHPAVCTCLSTHTFINSAKGEDVEAFCVQTLVTLKKDKTFTYYMKAIEFYNQDIGKVGYSVYYYYELASGKTINVFEIKETLSEYGFGEK